MPGAAVNTAPPEREGKGESRAARAPRAATITFGARAPLYAAVDARYARGRARRLRRAHRILSAAHAEPTHPATLPQHDLRGADGDRRRRRAGIVAPVSDVLSTAP